MARYKKRKTRGGTKVMPPTTIWEWYAPETISAQVGFDATPYSSNEDVQLDILSVLQQFLAGPFGISCNFPIYPKVSFLGTFVRTNIQEFVQFAGADPQDIPQQLSDSCRLLSQKDAYIGCGPPTGNLSQPEINTFIFDDRLKISSIVDMGDGTVLVAFQVSLVRAQDIFTKSNTQDPIAFPFFPYDTNVNPQAGVLVVGGAYLNNGKMKIGNFRAHYMPGNKYTPNPPSPFIVDFSIL